MIPAKLWDRKLRKVLVLSSATNERGETIRDEVSVWTAPLYKWALPDYRQEPDGYCFAVFRDQELESAICGPTNEGNQLSSWLYHRAVSDAKFIHSRRILS